MRVLRNRVSVHRLFYPLVEFTCDLAMAKFLSGPPGGRTLPQTATRLSDLVGGVYGPGASVASTGINTPRFAIKAGLARAAGETWEDVVEYFLVSLFRFSSYPS
jgi:SEL1 protein